MSDAVEGEISLGSGWWLELPRAYDLVYDEDGAPVLQRDVIRVCPTVFSFDADGLTEPVSGITSGIVEDSIADSAGALQRLGGVTGAGWRGDVCGGPLGDDEFQLVASLGAGSSILNLLITYFGTQPEDEAWWVVRRAVHRPDTDALTSQLAAADVRLVVPPGGFEE